MNRELHQAFDRARRAQLKERGGYEVVEKDARNHELLIDRRCRRGRPTYAELEAENGELRRRLKIEQGKVNAARKSRDVWRKRAEQGLREERAKEPWRRDRQYRPKSTA